MRSPIMRVLRLFALLLPIFMPARSVSAQQPAADGKVIYETSCRACHGPRGVPVQAMVKLMKVPPLDASYFAKHNEDSVVVVLKKGRGTNMKSFTGKLTAAEMESVAKYIKQ